MEGRLARASVLLAAAGFFAGAGGYAFHLGVARLLTQADYAALVAMLSASMVAGVVFSSLGLLVTRTMAFELAHGRPDKVVQLHRWTLVRIGCFVAVAIVAAGVGSPWLASFLRLESELVVTVFTVSILLQGLVVVNNALLQVRERFVPLGLGTATGAATKLLFCLSLAWLGAGLLGVGVGLVAATLSVLLVSYLPSRDFLAQNRGADSERVELVWRDIMPLLFANVAFAVLSQFDTMVVNYYFSGAQAGHYAAAAVLGKVVLYFPSAVAVALFPMIAQGAALNRTNAKLLLQSILLTALLAVCAAIFYALFAEQVVALLYGDAYRPAASILRWYGLAMFPLTLIVVGEYYLIAQRRVFFAWIIAPAVPVLLAALHWNHASPLQVLAMVAACAWTVALVGGVAVVLFIRRQHRLEPMPQV